jgi:hypothetical protein
MTPNDDGIIRITAEEANSTHVDDLLKRQMSMRGEPGVTRDRSTAWWYQNWFLFMIVGALGAVAAWAILEPFFDDHPYLQGPIEKLDVTDSLNRRLQRDEEIQLPRRIHGFVVVNGQQILLPSTITEFRPDGSKGRLERNSLKVGEVIGIYVEVLPLRQEALAIGQFIERSPRPLPAARAQLTLDQLVARTNAAGLLLFALVAGMVGLFIGAADGVICRLPRRAALCGTIGLLVGLVGGFVSSIAGNVAYSPLNQLAMRQMSESGSLLTFGFVIQVIGRSVAWCLVGMAMGLGQGIALRSKRLLIYGLIGGTIGGLLGGLLFDPIDILLLGQDKTSSHWSRLIGIAVIGAVVGAMIGIVELLARDAWLRMTQGPLTGKEFLVFKDVMKIGSSPRSDIYLFNDSLVAADHATLRAVGDECEIEARHSTHAVMINNRATPRGRLRHGDNITIGRTSFVFQRRKG